ncbi:hypothetical protein Bca52824_070826 [Brassica carinata]|uniref:Sodium/calcium exchanger membrane region domain-containing protein n=1 Tax=Brassica carinata TaxID=52824 RepID=A0A8X7U2L7_BRACI|nr:hypothetical protein Bca52824_070826 [Brassica carinata]
MGSIAEPWGISESENANYGTPKGLSRELRHGKTAHNMSSSSLRKKSDLRLIQKVPCKSLQNVLSNLQEVILGTKLAVLFLAIPLAVIADYYHYGRPLIFGLSLTGLTPLAERVSFLTEQLAFYTGPTVGGLLNATCGNATELIIAILALANNKVAVVKYSLLGSILSNLLLVLGSSLFCGGIANIRREQRFDRKQADVNFFLLLMGLLCHLLPLLLKYAATGEASASLINKMSLSLSRTSSIVMLIAYIAYLIFQLWTHRQLFEAQEDDEDNAYNDEVTVEETPVIGFWSGFAWLAGMTLVIALLSEYVVATIEDISLGVALGSATQISLFVVPLSVIVAWTMGIKMDLNFNILETSCLALGIIITAFTLQDGTSHYMKGLVLMLCYVIIAACFFVDQIPQPKGTGLGMQPKNSVGGGFVSA